MGIAAIDAAPSSTPHEAALVDIQEPLRDQESLAPWATVGPGLGNPGCRCVYRRCCRSVPCHWAYPVLNAIDPSVLTLPAVSSPLRAGCSMSCRMRKQS